MCGDDIFEAVTNWLERGYFPSSLNDTNWYLTHGYGYSLASNVQFQQQHQWQPPRRGWLKCNVDAGFHNGGRIATRGWCICDDTGQFFPAESLDKR
jgi:hypothetical protein